MGVEFLALMLVLALSAYLRLSNLEANPGWYSDEGTLVDIATHLLSGRWQYMAIQNSTLIAARPPLFPLLLSAVFSSTGASIYALRILTGTLGVISNFMVYLLLKRTDGRSISALLAALIYAIYPQAVVYSRLGFSYNLLAPLFLGACMGIWEYLRTGKKAGLVLASLAIGVGAISDMMMIMLAPALLVVVSTRRWRDVIWSLVWMGAPVVFYAAWMLARVPADFVFDLRFILTRLSEVPLAAQLPVVLLNFTYLITGSPWMLAGIIGLFQLNPLRWRRLALLWFFVPFIALARTTGFSSALTNYYLIALLPMIAIGASSLLQEGAKQVISTIQPGFTGLLESWGWRSISPKAIWARQRLVNLASSLVLLLVIVAPVMVQTLWVISGANGRFETGIDAVLVDAGNAHEAQIYLESRLEPGDLVIASPAVAWMFQAKVVDFQVSLAYEGKPTRHFPKNIPSQRFAYDSSLSRARYVVIDRIWRNWAAPNMPVVEEMMREVKSWPLVFSSGEIEIFENPRLFP